MHEGLMVADGGEGLDLLNSLNPDEYYFDSYADFMKAVTTNMGTAAGGSDMALLTGGAALRLQSIDPTLAESITRERDFKAFNRLTRKSIGGTLHEWTEETGIGGAAGHDFVGELDDIPEYNGTRARKTIEPAFIYTMSSVSFPQTRQDSIASTVSRENIASIRRIKRSANWAAYYGQKAANPKAFDGMLTQILATNDPDLILDAGGKGLSIAADEALNIARAVRSEGRFGRTTTLYCSPAVRTNEINQKLKSAIRVGIGGSTKSNDVENGLIVTGIRGSDGDSGVIEIVEDMYITEGDMPWEVRPGDFPALVTAAGLTIPAGVSLAVASSATSKFLAGHDGFYYYGIESYGPAGRSACLVSAQQAIAVGQKCTITITNPADNNVTGFVLHRSRRDGTNTKTDIREMLIIPRQAGASTVYVDENTRIPGTSPVFLTNEDPADEAIDIVQFFPLIQFPLFPTKKAVKPWAQLYSGALRMKKRRQHGVILNVLPDGARWRPFNV